MSIVKKPIGSQLIPENAVPLYIVTSGDKPKIEEYRLSHETHSAYRVYRTFGNNLTEHRGLCTIMFHNLNNWGHRAFFSHREALQCQRERLVSALDCHEKKAAEVRARLSEHVEQWGVI